MKMNNNPNDGRKTGDTCPCCGEGALALREHGNRKGAYFLGCDAFPECRWACDPNPADVRAARQRKRDRWKAQAILRQERMDERWEVEAELARRYWDEPEGDDDHDPDAELSSDLYLWLG